MKLVPLNDHVIVRAVDAKEQASASGIIIPDTSSKERPQQGEVVAVGPGKMLENGTRAAMGVSVGQRVVFKKYAPDEVKIERDELLVISESDIIAVIE
ncbi:MAG: co-chaperone GroES [Patescibacteria group bacterium]